MGMKISWTGAGPDECGIDDDTGRVVVRIDPRYFRPNEVMSLLGDAGKARRLLGWSPKTDFKGLIEEMARQDLAQAMREHEATANGEPGRAFVE